MKNYRLITGIAAFFILSMAVVSCNSEFDKLLPSKEYRDSTAATAKSRKVLYLIVDGARGWSVRDAQAPNITALNKNATYSWNSLSDSLSNNGNGWADLLTGVNKAKHKVIDDTFTGNKLDQYPGIFQRIKSIKPDTRVTSFASSSVFKDRLTTGSDVSQSYNTDAEVKAAIISELGNEASALIVGQFSSVNTAGLQFGYDNSFPAYKNAILQFDQYLGEMLTALKSRKNYAKEDWLIVLTSNHGGQAAIPAEQDDKTIFSYPKANTFTVISNISYKPYLVDKPFTGNKYTGKFLRLYSNPASTAATPATSVRAEVKNNNDVYNFGDTISFTIELKVKKNIRGTSYRYEWPAFFSKRFDKTKKVGNGWAFAWESDRWRFFMGAPGKDHQASDDPTNLIDGNWHSLAVVVLNRDFKRVIRYFRDGKYVSEKILPDNYGTMNNSAPLQMGLIPVDLNNPFDGYLSDIRIWKAALPDAVISQFSCDTRINQSHPYWNRLIGYWPANDGSGLIIKDESPAENDFYVSVGTGTTLQWDSLNDIICPPPTGDLARLVPKTTDLPSQILSWLAIAPPDTWKLDGRVWLNQ